jgi:prevent-host-death family protein
MPTIKPVSELRNYNTVLREVTAETPVFLTKNGHGRFAIVDIREYERLCLHNPYFIREARLSGSTCT